MRVVTLLAGALLSLQCSADVLSLPYGRQLDVSPVRALLADKPENLIKNIENLGVKVYVLPQSVREGQSVLDLSQQVRLTQEQYKKFGFEDIGLDTGEAVYVSATDPCCDLHQDFIAVGAGVEPITLVHEAMHFLLRKQLPANEQALAAGAETQKKMAHEKFTFRMIKIRTGGGDITDAHWRADLISAYMDDLEATLNLIRYATSEEVDIERTLQSIISPSSAFYDKKRLETGENYAKLKLKEIDNMVGNLEFFPDWFIDEGKAMDDSLYPLKEQFQHDKLFKKVAPRVQSARDEYNKLNKLGQ